jgi:hypothetical protein
MSVSTVSKLISDNIINKYMKTPGSTEKIAALTPFTDNQTEKPEKTRRVSFTLKEKK